MNFLLYIRDDNNPDHFTKKDRFSTYKLAGESGQNLAGAGNFYVSHINRSYAPSREEQLLQDIDPVKQKKAQRIQLTVHLAAED